MENPFETINDRLSKIENLLSDLKQPVKEAVQDKPQFKYTPIQEIFDRKICSKPTFYEHVHAGHFTLYKFGNKSFVDLEEFQQAFHRVQLKGSGNTKAK